MAEPSKDKPPVPSVSNMPARTRDATCAVLSAAGWTADHFAHLRKDGVAARYHALLDAEIAAQQAADAEAASHAQRAKAVLCMTIYKGSDAPELSYSPSHAPCGHLVMITIEEAREIQQRCVTTATVRCSQCRLPFEAYAMTWLLSGK